MRRIALVTVLAVPALLGVDSCASTAVKACQETYPTGSSGYEACAAAARQRDNAELERRVLEGRRSKE